MHTQHVMNANANGTVLPLWSSSYGYLTLMHVASGDWRRSMSSNTMVKCNFNDRRERRNDGKDALIFVPGAPFQIFLGGGAIASPPNSIL